MNKLNLFRGLLFTAMSMALFIVGLVVWAVYLEKPWLSYQNLPLDAINKTVIAGTSAVLLVERCNSTEEVQEYTLSRAIKDIKTGEIHTLKAIEKIPIPPGCTRDISGDVHVVPIGTPPGHYIFFGVATVGGTFGTQHKVVWYSEPFEVIAREAP